MSETLVFEQWKDVPGYEGIYAVSDQGRVRSYDRIDCLGRKHEGRMLLLASRNDPTRRYVSVTLCKDGVECRREVHRWVLETFVGPPKDNQVARHLNGNSRDNRRSNLAWGTPKENTHDMIRHGTYYRRPVVRSDGKVFPSVMEAARELGGDASSLVKVLNGRRHKHCGFGWRDLESEAA